MTMNLMFGALYFAISLYFAIFEGVGTCFALLYLPALIFFRAVPGYMINAGIPELSAANAAVMAMLIGMLIRINQKFPFRWNVVDVLILIAPFFTIVSAITTENTNSTYENLHTGYNELIKQVCGWTIPFFVARASFRSEAFRVKFLWVLIACIFVLTPFSLIEMRFRPQFFVEVLTRMGLQVTNDPMVMSRLGYFRAQVSFAHPIFFGDACLSMAILVLLLAHTTPVGTRNWFVRIAAGCAAFELLASVSFGPYMGMMVALLVFLLLKYTKAARPLLMPAALAVVIAMCFITAQIAAAPLPPRPGDGMGLADSMWIRQMIIRNTWPLVSDAGWFGLGRMISPKDLQLESVDNAYVLFAMCRGWAYAGIWLMIPILVGWRAVRAMNRFTSSQVHIFPLAIGAAGIIGVSAAFYGVWAGWAGEPYTMLWLITIGFTMTLADFCIEAAAAPKPSVRRPQAIINPPQPALARA